MVKEKGTLIIGLLLVAVLVVSGCATLEMDECEGYDIDLGNATCSELTYGLKCCLDRAATVLQAELCTQTYPPIITEVCYD